MRQQLHRYYAQELLHHHYVIGTLKGDKVGVVGLGGLGHMGVKFANALGAHVVMITTSPEKEKMLNV
jgi:D-arabinose 1-dehydrogenase-like Zn-dependent alcohol dehydrogenase